MIGFDLLCMGMEDVFLSKQIVSEEISVDKGLLMPEPHTALREDAVYVVTGDLLAEAICCGNPSAKITLFVSGSFPESILLPDNWNVVSVSLPLSSLHNRLSANLQHRISWIQSLSSVPFGQDGLLNLLQKAADLTQASFFYFDNCFHLIASGQAEHLIQQLRHPRDPQQLSPGLVNRLFGRILAGGAHTGAADTYQLSYRMYPVVDGHEEFGYLFVTEGTSGQPIETFSRLLKSFLLRHLRLEGRRGAFPVDDPFRLFVERMYVYYRHNAKRIIADMHQLPFRVGLWSRFLVIELGHNESTHLEMVPKVRALFPNTNLTVYDNKIILLLSCKEASSAEYEPVLEQLEEILEKHDLFAILSNAATLEKGIRTEYIQSIEVLNMLPKLRLPDERRCARLNRYLSYYCFHICATHLRQEFGHDRLVYFAYPEIVSLTRYDMVNNTDLRDVLFYYVLNDCKVTETAKFLHMHRNTVLYKINKIKELVGLNLDTGYEKAGILYSCQLLRYMECVQNQQGSVLESALEYVPKSK